MAGNPRPARRERKTGGIVPGTEPGDGLRKHAEPVNAHGLCARRYRRQEQARRGGMSRSPGRLSQTTIFATGVVATGVSVGALSSPLA